MLRCFLSHKLQQIKQVVDGILKSIFKFHALLRLGHWEEDENGQFIHTEYDAIIKTYLPFKEFTQFLNKGKHLIIMSIIHLCYKPGELNRFLAILSGPKFQETLFLPSQATY